MAHSRIVRFEWDEAKNLANKRKHGLSFEAASEVFSTNDFLEIFDQDHSIDEDRFIAIGLVVSGIVTVVWTERDEDVIRIISARPATKREAAAFLRHKENQ